MRRLLCAMLPIIAACNAEAPPPPLIPGEGGEVTVEWKKGAGGPNDSTGHFSAPAVAAWCAADTLLEVLAIRNDTAFGFTLLPADSLHPGNFSLYPATMPGSFRPQALVALRYLQQFGNMGFETRGGQLLLTDVAGKKISGSIDARLRGIDGRDSVTLSGRFAGLTVRPATGPCGRAHRPRAQ